MNLQAGPPNQHLARPLQPPPTDELGQGGRRWLRPATRQAGQAGEDGVGFLETDVLDLGAIARVPAKRRAPEPPRFLDHYRIEPIERA